MASACRGGAASTAPGGCGPGPGGATSHADGFSAARGRAAQASRPLMGCPPLGCAASLVTWSGWRPTLWFPVPYTVPYPAHVCSMLSRIYKASDARLAPAKQHRRITAPVRGVPVYVMLPLDTVWLLERGGTTQPFFIREKAMEVGLEMLSRAGVDGVMIDVWWGIAEHAGPGQYDFSAYRKLFEQVASKGLKVQAVMSFHAGGDC